MATTTLERERAWDLLCLYTESERLRKHGLAVEAVMRSYAEVYGQDPDLWGLTGLLHDFDYERHPTREGHPYEGRRILEAQGYPDTVIRAIMGHADYTGVPRDTDLARALFSADELSGFVMAVALVRGRSLAGLSAPVVRKKLRDKAFARSVSREDVMRGAEELGVDLDAHIERVVAAMATIAPQLELTGP